MTHIREMRVGNARKSRETMEIAQMTFVTNH